MLQLNTQVSFETTAAAAEAAPGLPTPVGLQMHGSEGVTSPLQFEPFQEGGVAVYERNAEACGELSQLTVWLEPTAVSSCCLITALSTFCLIIAPNTFYLICTE